MRQSAAAFLIVLGVLLQPVRPVDAAVAAPVAGAPEPAHHVLAHAVRPAPVEQRSRPRHIRVPHARPPAQAAWAKAPARVRLVGIAAASAAAGVVALVAVLYALLLLSGPGTVLRVSRGRRSVR